MAPVVALEHVQGFVRDRLADQICYIIFCKFCFCVMIFCWRMWSDENVRLRERYLFSGDCCW